MNRQPHPFETLQEGIPGGAHYVAACPYCQHKNNFKIQEVFGRQLTNGRFASETKLVTCDNETGGCDRDFVVRVRAEVVFTVEAFPVRGLDPAADAELSDSDPDRRLWEVKIRHADDPEGDSTEYLSPEQVAERARRQPLYALALSFADGDKLEVVSPNNLVEVKIRCTEPEEAERFDSYRAAYSEARRRALNSGAPVEIYFDGEGSFRLFRTDPLPLPPPAPSFERVAVVETPVLFTIEFDKHNADAGQTRVEVHCNDRRANVGLDGHGETLVYYSEAFPAGAEGEREAVRDAVSWIHSEHGQLDVEIQAPFDLTDLLEDVPFDDGDRTDDRPLRDRD